jgi:hypothetical protein
MPQQNLNVGAVSNDGTGDTLRNAFIKTQDNFTELYTTKQNNLVAGYGDSVNPYGSKTANQFLAAPNGSAGAPTFRAIVAADIPTLNQNTTGTAANVTGTVAVANGGTGQTTYTNGQLLIGNTTGGTLVKATLTQGTGITIANAAGSITITNSAPHIATNLSYTASTRELASSTGTNVTLPLATGTDAGLLSNTDKSKLDGIAANANNYTLPSASTTVTGGVRLGSDTQQTVAANAVTTTAARSYAVQVNASGQMLVNVPWVDTDTNTTYSAGNGIALTTTTFSVAAGTGLTQEASGLALTAITAGAATVGAVRYNGTTKVAGQFDGSTTAPTNTTRLNYDGDFYATNIYASTVFQANTTSTRDKYRVWNSSAYAIGMQNSITYGAINNNYAMTFQMDTTAGRGFWWGTNAHTTAQGAMALSIDGLLSVASGARIGYGVSDTTLPTANVVDINGLLTATTKSFTIKHPTKEGKRLRYGSLEGPENGVYVRGKLEGSVIELPEYWTKLVDPDSITVQLTPIGKHQKLYVEDIRDNKVYVGVDGFFAGTIKCFYYVLAERADVEKLQTEID